MLVRALERTEGVGSYIVTGILACKAATYLDLSAAAYFLLTQSPSPSGLHL